jgi:hypothetical protein
MDVPLAVLADAANAAADGRLNILGIFSEIRSSQFPAIHPAAVLVFQLRAHRSEQGGRARVTVRLMDLDSVLAEIEGEFVIPVGDEPGDVIMNQIFALQMLALPNAGDYAFHILVNNDEKNVVRFRAILLPASPIGA